jgi:hypothetical protein
MSELLNFKSEFKHIIMKISTCLLLFVKTVDLLQALHISPTFYERRVVGNWKIKQYLGIDKMQASLFQLLQ